MRSTFAVLLAALSSVCVSAADLRGSTVAAHRPIADAVIWLEAPSAPPTPHATAVLDQRNLSFVPHVLAVRVGTTVDFPNNDRVFHNVFSFRDGKVFDLGLYPVGVRRSVTFDRPGLSRIYCNIHPGMAAYVMTVDTPYFATSDASGAFTLVNVPAGRYTYHAWYAGAAETSGIWSFDGTGTLTIEWP